MKCTWQLLTELVNKLIRYVILIYICMWNLLMVSYLSNSSNIIFLSLVFFPVKHRIKKNMCPHNFLYISFNSFFFWQKICKELPLINFNRLSFSLFILSFFLILLYPLPWAFRQSVSNILQVLFVQGIDVDEEDDHA